MEQSLEQSAAWLKDARHVVVLTGAGISAESGIPTFRDAMEGYWSKYDPEELATPEAFERNPELVSRWYDERRQKVLGCEPNAGHRALAELESYLTARGAEFVILTQNVDGLHVRAGSQNVVEVHGSLLRWRSTRSGMESTELPMPLPSHPYPAPDGGLWRPGVVWFGENLPEEAVERAHAAILQCDVFISVGTSGLVYPAAGWPAAAKRSGAATIEINRDVTPLSPMFDLVIRGSAGQLLPALVRKVEQP